MLPDNLPQLLKGTSTPCFYYDVDLLERTVAAMQTAAGRFGYRVHYALKANSNNKLVKIIAEAGVGADCVSGNEILRAKECGITNDHIAFAGVGKNDDEINIGLDNDIFSFNVESIQEIEVINELAAAKGKKARIALRLNPDVNANTHHYITTGLEENKFGISKWELEEVLKTIDRSENIELIGIHFHIGSQIIDMNSYRNLCLRVNDFQEWFREHNIRIDHVNVGGGLGIDYFNPDANSIVDFESFFGIFNEFLELYPHQTLHFELGRSIIGLCGDLIAKVLYIKNGVKTNFAILDAGMTELIRPALYQSYHKIENLSKKGSSNTDFYDVVGPICESSDLFGKRVKLPVTERGDLVAIRCAGAYGEVMQSQYNLREKAEVIYSDEL